MYVSSVPQPLALQSLEAWKQRWTAKQKAYFPDERDWLALYEFAQEFKQEFGPPVVVCVGEKALWFDTGTPHPFLLELSVTTTTSSMEISY